MQDGHLDLTEIKEIAVLPAETEKWKLRTGDLLLTEGGDWDKLGREPYGVRKLRTAFIRIIFSEFVLVRMNLFPSSSRR